MDPSDFMAASRAVAREKESCLQRPKEVAFQLEHLGQKGDYTSDPDMIATIRQLPPHLQSVMTLMANMVPPGVEVTITTILRL